MLDARAIGRELGKHLLSVRGKPVEPLPVVVPQVETLRALPAAPQIDVHLPEMVVNIAPQAPVETVIPAPLVNVQIDPAVHNIAAPNVSVAAPVVNVTVDMTGIEAAMSGMASLMLKSAEAQRNESELIRLGLKNLSDAGQGVAAALMAPKVLVNGPDGKPARVEPVKVI